MEDNPGHPKAVSGLRIGGNIVNVHGFLGPDLAGLEGLTIDERVGLARADAVGIDADGKEAEEGEARLLLGHVDGVGIRKQGEPVVLRKVFEERFRVDRVRVKGAIPHFTELLEGERGAETFGQMKVPIPRRDAPLLPIEPAGVLFNRGPDILRRQREAGSQSVHGARDVHADQDAPDIEDDGAKLGDSHSLFAFRTGSDAGAAVVG